MRPSSRLALVLACFVTAQPAHAETSSWFGGKDESKSAPAKPKKAPADKPPASQKTPQAPNTSTHAKTIGPASGDDAAYIAFDHAGTRAVRNSATLSRRSPSACCWRRAEASRRTA
jgi:hypothetical protein